MEPDDRPAQEPPASPASSPRNALRELVFEYLERVEDEGPEVLEEICGREPGRADALRARVRLLRGAGLDDSVGADAPPEELGPFRLVERIGGGGMGVVFLARDETLGRDVAVKVVRPGELLFPGARARFQREVESVARLSHPGIVPVFSAGEDKGVPYFAMERVEGCTLGEALRTLVDEGRRAAELEGADLGRAVELASGCADGASAGSDLFEGPWTDACARIARSVADALAHAHDAGILHRDVKPSNVMITPEGRVMLVDFGLSSSEGVDRITRTGSALGSLPYMSPEQLDGDRERLDRRSDVYSLGVTLYELLTLELPFEAPSVSRMRSAIVEGRSRPARELNPRVSWELDTITAVAMDPEPERRYASCSALSRDLEAALDRRPIAARRAGALHRARRWARRRPTAAALAALSGLVVVGGPLVFGIQQRNARLAAEAQGRIISVQRGELAEKNAKLADALADLEQALDTARERRDEAVAQEGRAERNFERAMRAVDAFLTRIGDEELRDVPLFHELRARVLEDALAFFTELAEDQADDPRLRLQTARASKRVGDVLAMLDRVDEAYDAFRRSLDLLLELTEEQPDDAAIAFEVLETRRVTAGLLRARSRHRDAESEIRAALAVAERFPDDVAIASGGRKMRVMLAAAIREQGRHGEARSELESVLVDLEGAYERNPTSPSNASDLVLAHQEIGGAVMLESSRASRDDPRPDALFDLGSSHYERALDVLSESLDRWPDDSIFRREMARALMNLANIRMGQQRLDDAEDLIDRGIVEAERLVDDYPGVPTYVEDHGVSLGLRGAILVQIGRFDEGTASFEAAEAVFVELVRLQPERPESHGRLAQMQFGHGQFLWRPIDDLDGALDKLGLAIENYRVTLDLAPGLARRKFELELSLEYSMAIHLERDEVVDAAEDALAWADLADERIQVRNAALWLARCASAAESSDALEGEEATELAGALDARAADLVQRLLDIGTPLAELRSDPRLADLRARPVAAGPLRSD